MAVVVIACSSGIAAADLESYLEACRRWALPWALAEAGVAGQEVGTPASDVEDGETLVVRVAEAYFLVLDLACHFGSSSSADFGLLAPGPGPGLALEWTVGGFVGSQHVLPIIDPTSFGLLVCR